MSLTESDMPDTSETPLENIDDEPIVEENDMEDADVTNMNDIEPYQSVEFPTDDDYQDINNESSLPPPDMISQGQLD